MKALQSESELARMQFAILSSNILSGKQNSLFCKSKQATSFPFHKGMEYPQKRKKTIYNDNNVYSVCVYMTE